MPKVKDNYQLRVKIGYRIDPAILQALRKYAKENNIKQITVIEEGIKLYIKENGGLKKC